MKKLFLSDEELKIVIQLEAQIQQSLANAKKVKNAQEEEIYINNAQTLTNIKNDILNGGKQVKGIDKTVIFTSVLGFISVRQLLEFEKSGVITSKVFPSITKWIGK